MSSKTSTSRERPPIVAIVGHIDHGKSTLLDYIRKTSITEKEAGGITQHLSAYEAEHSNATGTHHITFLDTPGHEAFRAMRSRGLEVADVAVLVVSAEDGAKPQTLEAVKLIEETKLPYIVAITKIDKPGADVEKAKMSLLENGIYLEGLGGEIPFIAISSKTGQGIPELFHRIDTVLDFDTVETVRFRIPMRDGAAIASLHECGKVRAEDYHGNLCEIEVEAPESLRRRLSRYLIRKSTLPVENSVNK